MVDPNITSLFNDIYDSINRKVFAFLAAHCKGIPDAHDLFQDTYTELYAVLKRRGADYIKTAKLLSCVLYGRSSRVITPCTISLR